MKKGTGPEFLGDLDYSVVQQCMHCGMCLPACPTYDETLDERSSPRGRIAMMRGIADGNLDLSRRFADEMYFCLGCLACQTACPAGVDYAALFENARDHTRVPKGSDIVFTDDHAPVEQVVDMRIVDFAMNE